MGILILLNKQTVGEQSKQQRYLFENDNILNQPLINNKIIISITTKHFHLLLVFLYMHSLILSRTFDDDNCYWVTTTDQVDHHDRYGWWSDHVFISHHVVVSQGASAQQPQQISMIRCVFWHLILLLLLPLFLYLHHYYNSVEFLCLSSKTSAARQKITTYEPPKHCKVLRIISCGLTIIIITSERSLHLLPSN